jgi:hypothetical protein
VVLCQTAEIIHYLDEASAKILEAIRAAPKEDVELRHLERNAFEVKCVQHGSAREMFFMGSASNVSLLTNRNVHWYGIFTPEDVGKSSVFNMIFNQPGLAKKGAKGDACTSVVVRYTAGAQETSDGFSVIIHYLRAVTIKDFIDAHSKVYFQR